MKIKTTLRGMEDVDNLLSQIAPNQARNIMRSTVHDMALQVAKEAKGYMPEDTGAMVEGTKAKREKIRSGKVRSTVRVAGAYYWRFLEYGHGPDNVEHAFFMRAVHRLKIDMNERFLRSFVKKFESTLARARKRHGG